MAPRPRRETVWTAVPRLRTLSHLIWREVEAAGAATMVVVVAVVVLVVVVSVVVVEEEVDSI